MRHKAHVPILKRSHWAEDNLAKPVPDISGVLVRFNHPGLGQTGQFDRPRVSHAVCFMQILGLCQEISVLRIHLGQLSCQSSAVLRFVAHLLLNRRDGRSLDCHILLGLLSTQGTQRRRHTLETTSNLVGSVATTSSSHVKRAFGQNEQSLRLAHFFVTAKKVLVNLHALSDTLAKIPGVRFGSGFYNGRFTKLHVCLFFGCFNQSFLLWS